MLVVILGGACGMVEKAGHAGRRRLNSKSGCPIINQHYTGRVQKVRNLAATQVCVELRYA